MQRTASFFGGLFALVALCLLVLVCPAEAADIKYCSSQNTGADSQELVHNWQSNGWCYDQCKQNYAFAIVQDLSCWCSNYIPSDQTSTSDCDENCPGYPSEKCGNKDKNLFGYIALPQKPSGTQGVSTTISASDVPTTYSSTEPSSQTTLKTTPKSSTPPTPTSAPPTSAPSVLTVTAPGGSVILQTVVASAPASSKKAAVSAGTIAGIVVGVVLGLFLVVGVVGFALWRHRKSKKNREPSIQRNTSTLSRTGLLKTPVIDTSMTNQSNDKDDTPISNHHRDSGFLRPNMLRNNISRNSVNTINDNEDYSRPLKVRNPDPDQ